MLNRYSVLIPCIQRYEGNISRAYTRILCLSTLLQNCWQFYYIDNVPYFIVANLLYLMFVLLGRFGVLSYSLASPVWDASHEWWY